MSLADRHPEYPSEAQIEEMWAAYQSTGREGILEFLRKRTLAWQRAECPARSDPDDTTEN